MIKRPNRLSFRLQQGVGLIELMVSITIGLVILAGVVQIYLSSIQNQQGQEGVSRIQENLRYLFKRLESDISQAGFTGCFPFTDGRIAVTLAQDTGVGDAYDFSSFIVGENDAGMVNSDSLTIRYASGGGAIPLRSGMATSIADVELEDTDPDYAGLEQYDIVMISDCSRAAVFMITNDPTGSNGTIEHALNVISPSGSVNEGQSNSSLELENQFGAKGIDGGSTAFLYAGGSGAHTYAIGTSAAGTAAGEVCAQNTPNYCAMFRDGQELIEGVEDFQLEFGEQAANGNLSFADASGVGDWTAVDRVRVTVTFNSIEEARTNDGADFMTRTASRIVMIRNQLPSS